jgi:hypothetical protein
MLATLQKFMRGPKPALIVGSGPSATDLQNTNLTRFHRVAINNAWRVRGDFDYAIYPGDFPVERHPPVWYPAKQVNNFGYMPSMNAAGGIIFCGATMAFAAGYWAADTLESRVIGFHACDMVYSPGKTHFYGQGTADPLREDISLQSLEAKSARLFCWALERDKLLVNCSESDESRLVFPRVPLATAASLRPRAKEAWAPLRKKARKIWQLEATAPFDALVEEYWLLADTLEKRAFVAEIDREWLALAPTIRDITPAELQPAP